MPLRDQELHAMGEWIAAVEKTRSELGVVRGSPGEVGHRLGAIGFDDVVQRVRACYRGLVRRTGLHDRYVGYFAACVVSHFDYGDLHRLPAWLAERLRRWQAVENPVPPGAVRVSFHHGRAADQTPTLRTIPEFIQVSEERKLILPSPLILPPGFRAVDNDRSITEPTIMAITPHSNDPTKGTPVGLEPHTATIGNLLAELDSPDWRTAPLPYGLEIIWPYEVPMLSLNEADLLDMRRELGDWGVMTTWVRADRLVAFHGGKWVVLPWRLYTNMPGMVRLQRLMALPDNAVIAQLVLPFPLVLDGSGAVHVIEFDNSPPPGKIRVPWAFRHLGEVRPFQPKVTADRSLPNDEVAFVKAWEDLTHRITVHPAVRPGRGAPPKRTKVPGLRTYSKVVMALFRQKLIEWGQQWLTKARERGEPASAAVPDPPREERRMLWQSARREARRVIPEGERDTIPDGAQEAVEREAPWRQAIPGAANAEKPPA